MIEIPYELRLALKTIVDSETMSDHENQELIFILYQHEKLTWDEIKEKATITSFGKTSLRECINGLWVEGFFEGGFEEHQKYYSLSIFGRRLLERLLDAMFIVREEQR